MDIPVNIGQKMGIEGKAAAATDIIQPIIDYHVALEMKNLELLRNSVYTSVYRVYCGHSDHFGDWEPWPRLTREDICRNFGHAFDNDDFYYENKIDFCSVVLNGDEALIRTHESGRPWKDRSWEQVEVLWHTTRISDEVWQIAGHVHHLGD